MESWSDAKKKWGGYVEQHPPNPMTLDEYAKVCAALVRIEGLRGAIAAAIGGGLLTSFMIFIAALSVSANSYEITVSVVGVFVPFLMIAAYLIFRVDEHVERLSRGEYEPPLPASA